MNIHINKHLNNNRAFLDFFIPLGAVDVAAPLHSQGFLNSSLMAPLFRNIGKNGHKASFFLSYLRSKQ
jgi:hypothetical protein